MSPAVNRARRGIAVLWVATLATVLAGVALAQPNAGDAEATLALVPNAPEDVRQGAMLYDYHCSACHGDTGGGLAEARRSFPRTHRDCTSCHRPHNPPQMEPRAMTPRSAFDVGAAPAVVGQDAVLSRFGSGAALFAYVRATMPRPWPASLGDDDYLKITAFLLAANGVDAGGVPATPEDLPAFDDR